MRDPLELELQVVLSHYMGPGSQPERSEVATSQQALLTEAFHSAFTPLTWVLWLANVHLAEQAPASIARVSFFKKVMFMFTYVYLCICL